jgi:hypothetical protein
MRHTAYDVGSPCPRTFTGSSCRYTVWSTTSTTLSTVSARLWCRIARATITTSTMTAGILEYHYMC